MENTSACENGGIQPMAPIRMFRILPSLSG